MRLILILACLMVEVTRAATINVASPPTLANAQIAYNAAATSGDTIVFPLNGAATWNSTLTNNSKAVTIDGNGTTLTAGATLPNGFFYVTGFTSSSLMRITGFTFNSGSINTGNHALKILNSVTLTQLRVDHNTFKHGEIQVEVGGSIGVFDHNTFQNGRSSVYYTAGSRAQADAAWVSMAAGTANALFFEDNTFLYDAGWLGANENNACFDTYNGGKIVIRHNSFIGTNVPASWTGPLGVLELHGNAGAGAPIAYWEADSSARRGQSIVEIYNNTVNAKRVDQLAKLRGSSSLVYSNTLDTTAFNPYLVMYEEEQYEAEWVPNRTAWPAEDQVHNSFFWNNTLRLNGVPNTDYISIPATSTDYIQLNRDYFMHAPQSSGGSESFTGANGASGSHPTDGSPYPTLGTMTFSALGANAYYPYTPYTYPYPSVASNPTISAVANQTTAPDTSTGPIAFTVGDPVDPASSLTVGVTSSNHTLVDDADCVLGGSGSSRTVAITPNAGQTGSTTIKLIVTNLSLLTATNTFTLTVGSPAPVVTGNGKLKGNRGRIK